MGVLRFLFFDASSGSTRLVEEELGGRLLGPIDYGLELHVSRYRSFEAPVFSPRNVVVMGRGVFAGSVLFGSHRMVVVFRSPVSRGFHVSTVGGAGYAFMGTGLHGVVVEGWSEEPVVLMVRGGRRGFEEAWSWEIGWERLWDIWRGYGGAGGVVALTRFLVDKFPEVFRGGRGRALVTGPAAARTLTGGLFSIGVRAGGGLDPAAFDSASRGGAGSVLLRAHGVAAIVFWGDYDPSAENPRLRDRGLFERAARDVLGKGYVEAVKAATVKYRYDPRLGTGGTFGVNYVHYRWLLPFLGYNTVYLSLTMRSVLVEAVLKHLWEPVQREVFEGKGPRPWGTCGEPCPATCKKVWRGKKLDYEPSNAMGPFIGVFCAEEMARLVELVDELGLDAIEAGHVVAWLFDLIERGLLRPEELGLEERPIFDPFTVVEDPVKASRVNSRLAEKILRGMVEHSNAVLMLIATRGLRAAAQALNERYAGRVAMRRTGFHDVAVYAAFGDKGYMTPNYYWSPGVVAPLPVLGRYWTVYSPSFSEPEAMAETAYHRAVNEYLVDNAGFCRFHRHWLEKLLHRLYRDVWGIDVDLVGHAKQVLAGIYEYQVRAGAEPRPWESRKTIDMVAGIAAEMGAHEWAVRLASEPGAAREWWERFHRRVLELLGAGARSSAR